MRQMVRLLVASVAVASGFVLAASAAAPVTPSYQGVERTIQAIRKSWDARGPLRSPIGPGWDAIFDAVLNDLREYGKCCGRYPIDWRRSTTSTSFQRFWAPPTWQPAANLREELREWLRPRLRLAWARRRLERNG